MVDRVVRTQCMTSVEKEVIPVANIKSKKKRIKTNEKARQRNKAIRSRLHTENRKFRELVAAGDKAGAKAQLRLASREYDKAVTKGTLHRNNAANKKSAMAKLFNSMD